ncbi:hypothetical protein FOCC_FOCC001671, partial [Frankliniella occidentalis]
MRWYRRCEMRKGSLLIGFEIIQGRHGCSSLSFAVRVPHRVVPPVFPALDLGEELPTGALGAAHLAHSRQLVPGGDLAQRHAPLEELERAAHLLDGGPPVGEGADEADAHGARVPVEGVRALLVPAAPDVRVAVAAHQEVVGDVGPVPALHVVLLDVAGLHNKRKTNTVFFFSGSFGKLRVLNACETQDRPSRDTHTHCRRDVAYQPGASRACTAEGLIGELGRFATAGWLVVPHLLHALGVAVAHIGGRVVDDDVLDGRGQVVDAVPGRRGHPLVSRHQRQAVGELRP